MGFSGEAGGITEHQKFSLFSFRLSALVSGTRQPANCICQQTRGGNAKLPARGADLLRRSESHLTHFLHVQPCEKGPGHGEWASRKGRKRRHRQRTGPVGVFTAFSPNLTSIFECRGHLGPLLNHKHTRRSSGRTS